VEGLEAGGAGAGAGGGFFELKSEAGHGGSGARKKRVQRASVRTVQAEAVEARPKLFSKKSACAVS
jgi:hypothetical protein